jgi:hypothetical protein
MDTNHTYTVQEIIEIVNTLSEKDREMIKSDYY